MARHDITLQRLDVFHNNNGQSLFYPPSSFSNVSDWDNKPIIMALKYDKTGYIQHPDHQSVINGTLDPSEYKVVGYLSDTHLAESGSPRVMSVMNITDDDVETLFTANDKLDLSSGFEAMTVVNHDGENTIYGEIKPNHVLLFKSGACKNCYPNDKGACINNIEDNTMDEDKVASSLFEKLSNMFKAKEESEVTEVPPIDNVEDKYSELNERIASIETALKEKLDKIDNLESKLAEANAKLSQADIDAKFTAIQNVIPVGWENAKEEFTADPVAFMTKLTVHNTEHPAEVKKAQGVVSVSNTEECECTVKNFETKYGYTFVEN